MGKVIVEHITMGFSGETSKYYGYFNTSELAAEWVRKKYSD